MANTSPLDAPPNAGSVYFHYKKWQISPHGPDTVRLRIRYGCVQASTVIDGFLRALMVHYGRNWNFWTCWKSRHEKNETTEVLWSIMEAQGYIYGPVADVLRLPTEAQRFTTVALPASKLWKCDGGLRLSQLYCCTFYCSLFILALLFCAPILYIFSWLFWFWLLVQVDTWKDFISDTMFCVLSVMLNCSLTQSLTHEWCVW